MELYPLLLACVCVEIKKAIYIFLRVQFPRWIYVKVKNKKKQQGDLNLQLSAFTLVFLIIYWFVGEVKINILIHGLSFTKVI